MLQGQQVPALLQPWRTTAIATVCACLVVVVVLVGVGMALVHQAGDTRDRSPFSGKPDLGVAWNIAEIQARAAVNSSGYGVIDFDWLSRHSSGMDNDAAFRQGVELQEAFRPTSYEGKYRSGHYVCVAKWEDGHGWRINGLQIVFDHPEQLSP